MQTVEIRLPPAELPRQMAAMRSWLDEHRFEASAFSCDETPPDCRVSVTFGGADAATAFAARFAGRVQPRTEGPALPA
jgi:hypothetical protein